MSQTTGPILAVGAVTVANNVIFHDEPMDWRVPVATGLAAIGFLLAWLRRRSVAIFSLYRIGFAMGIVLLVLAGR